MATNISPVTELDFDNIKADIIAFMKNDPTFTDYSFEGSALNSIIDMLAYNTHTNAYYANMLHNEGFLDTAQKRASVVSRAKELGYIPRSVVGSTAFLDITVTGPDTMLPYVIPRGTSFASSNDIGTYSFVCTDTVTSSLTELGHLFTSVKLVAGSLVSNYFAVDTLSNVRSIFTIPNKNIDISTLTVKVKDTLSTVESTEYFPSTSVYNLVSTSNVYFIQESYDGFYQIYFGGDILGTQPTNGNIITVEYVESPDYSLANECRLFSFPGSFGAGTSTNLATTQVSFGGSDKENIDSIKINAVKSNTAKDRVVTVSDYEIFLKKKFNFIKSVSVWGGESNNPPVYGKVFLSMQPVSGYTISDSVKNSEILPAVKSASLMTITPEFVDPTYTLLSISTKLKFNQYKTVSSQPSIEGLVKSAIVAYVDSISFFGGDYLESNLLSNLSSIDPGILSVGISKTVCFRLSPMLGTQTTHIKNLNMSVISGTVKSTKFYTYVDIPILVTILEIPGKSTIATDTSGNMFTTNSLGLFTESGVLLKEIGTINLRTGAVNIVFSVHSYLTSNRFVSISCTPQNTDIITTNNQILMLPADIEDPTIGLVSNNKVSIESYVK